MIEHKIQGRSESLSSALGLHFQPKFENLLTLIPHSQIVVVDPKPLGEGERGVVYKAVWSRPQNLRVDKPVEVQVALKLVKIHGNSDLKPFMKEVSRSS